MQLKDLSFSYNGSRYIFKDINLDILPGITTIFGSNSSGKTTLWRILSGTIPGLYKGILKGSIALDERSKYDGIYIPHDNDLCLMHEKLDDEISFFTKISGFRFKNVDDFFNFWDIGMLRFKKSNHLSYGQKQKYSISLLLSFENDGVIVLDEPFSYLDDINFKLVSDILKKIKDKRVIILSHYFKELEIISDKVYRIENMNIVEGNGDLKEAFFTLKSSKQSELLIDAIDIVNEKISRKISMKLRKGEIKIIYGVNGSGKTTFLKIISGFEKKYSGKINFYGNLKITDIFYIPANPDLRIFAANINELFGDLKNEYMLWLLKIFNLEDKFNLPISHLSYGEKQKLLLAYSILKQKKVIIIDEPLMSFDYKSSKIISDILNDFVKKGGAVIIATPSKKNFILDNVEILEI